MDSILSSRDQGEDTKYNTITSVKTTFMQEWDGLRTTADRVIVVASTNRPYALDQAVLRRMPRRLESLCEGKYKGAPAMEASALLRLQSAIGMGAEDAQMVVESMAQTGVEPTYCMGDDIPLAVLSDKPHMLADYFKQRFAQVRRNCRGMSSSSRASAAAARLAGQQVSRDWPPWLGACC